jgi:hypothetical protein
MQTKFVEANELRFEVLEEGTGRKPPLEDTDREFESVFLPRRVERGGTRRAVPLH